MAVVKRTALGLVAGLLGWVAVWFVWRPILGSTGHMISFGMASIPHKTLLRDDFLLDGTILLLQAIASGTAVSFSRSALIMIAIPEFFFPWTFMYGWVFLLAPPSNNYNVIETLCWMSLTIVMNLTIVGVHSLFVGTRLRSGIGARGSPGSS